MATAEFPELPAGEGQLYARMVTSLGTMVIVLEEKRAPKTVKNFVGLATGTQTWKDPESGSDTKGKPYYDGTIFHRVIPDFMIQGGDILGVGYGGPGYKFGDEFHPELRHTGAGILSMANSGPNSNGSQFFVTERATPHLDNKHTVFGHVIVGADIVSKIADVPTGEKNKPKTDVVIERLEIFRSPTPPTA